jgi:LmbE family N-acetylglucosaminyl deacetylase
MRFEGFEISSAMVIYAHPDDAEFGAAGTVAKWADEGVEITYVLCTNGASGSSDPQMTRERLAKLRVVEQQDAADVLGVKRVVPLGFEDGYLYPTLELRKAVAREIRRWRPDAIITPHDPAMRTFQTFYINHPDHIAVGEAVYRAVNPDASSGLMFPELWRDEGFEPYLASLLLVSTFSPEAPVVVDITGSVDRKIAALQCHRSQIQDPDDVETFVRERSRAVGEPASLEYAEGFTVFRLTDLP